MVGYNKNTELDQQLIIADVTAETTELPSEFVCRESILVVMALFRYVITMMHVMYSGYAALFSLQADLRKHYHIDNKA